MYAISCQKSDKYNLSKLKSHATIEKREIMFEFDLKLIKRHIFNTSCFIPHIKKYEAFLTKPLNVKYCEEIDANAL